MGSPAEEPSDAFYAMSSAAKYGGPWTRPGSTFRPLDNPVRSYTYFVVDITLFNRYAHPAGPGASEPSFLIFRFFSEDENRLETIIFYTFRPRDHEIRILLIESFQIDLDSAKLKSSRENYIF